jgi:intracellular septation protein
MKFLFDLFPLLVFFVAYSLAGIYAATAAGIAASVAQIGWLLARRRKVDAMLWVTLVIVVVFGGLTLLLHNEMFIKWKPTVLYWCFAVGLTVAELFFGRNPIRSVLEKQLTLSEHAWPWVNRSWAVFFAALGALNLYVAFNFPTDTWVRFKVLGATGLTVVFVVAQGLVLSRYVLEDPTDEGR